MKQTTQTLNSVLLMKPWANAPMIAAGRKASSTPITNRRAAGSLNIAVAISKSPEIDRQDCQDGAELNQNHEGLAERLVIESEEALDQQQMPGRGHRQEFRQALDDAENECLEKIECHEELRRRGKDGRPRDERRSAAA